MGNLFSRVAQSKWVSLVVWRWGFQAMACAGLTSLLVVIPQVNDVFRGSGFWAVSSAVVVLETTTGGSIKKSIERVVGTIVGGIGAYGAFTLLTWNESIAREMSGRILLWIFLCLWPLPWGVVRAWFPNNPLIAVYGAFTGNIVVIASFLDGGAIQLAVLRIMAVVAGVLAAALVVHTVFPNRARYKVTRGVADVLLKLADILEPVAELECGLVRSDRRRSTALGSTPVDVSDPPRRGWHTLCATWYRWVASCRRHSSSLVTVNEVTLPAFNSTSTCGIEPLGAISNTKTVDCADPRTTALRRGSSSVQLISPTAALQRRRNSQRSLVDSPSGQREFLTNLKPAQYASRRDNVVGAAVFDESEGTTSSVATLPPLPLMRDWTHLSALLAPESVDPDSPDETHRNRRAARRGPISHSVTRCHRTSINKTEPFSSGFPDNEDWDNESEEDATEQSTARPEEGSATTNAPKSPQRLLPTTRVNDVGRSSLSPTTDGRASAEAFAGFYESPLTSRRWQEALNLLNACQSLLDDQSALMLAAKQELSCRGPTIFPVRKYEAVTEHVLQLFHHVASLLFSLEARRQLQAAEAAPLEETAEAALRDTFGTLIRGAATHICAALRVLAACLLGNSDSTAKAIDHIDAAAQQIANLNSFRSQRRDVYAAIVDAAVESELRGRLSAASPDLWRAFLGVDEAAVRRMNAVQHQALWDHYWQLRDRLSVTCGTLMLLRDQLYIICGVISEIVVIRRRNKLSGGAWWRRCHKTDFEAAEVEKPSLEVGAPSAERSGSRRRRSYSLTSS